MAEDGSAVQLFSRARKSGKRKKQPADGAEGGRVKRAAQQPAAAAAQAAAAAAAGGAGHQQLEQQDVLPLPERALNPASTSAPAAGAAGCQPEPTAALSAASFRELGVSDWLCSVCTSLGIRRPTQVQAGCIPAVLAGRDVIGTAQTGSGKTAAFALPILQSLARDPYGIYALVLTPTRELAMQLADQFRAFGAGMSLTDAVVIGGMDGRQQAQALSRRPHVVVATPGRLAALVAADTSLGDGFRRLRFLVLDEADRLLEASFEAELRALLALLPREGRQTLLFSATLTASLAKLQAGWLEGAYVFQAYSGLRTADTLREQYLFIPHKVKDVYLAHLLTSAIPALQSEQHKAAAALAAASGTKGGAKPGSSGPPHPVRSAIVFVSTCKGCHMLSLVLRELGLPAAALHSGKSQKQRLAALGSFKAEAVPLLLATDVASRGLDIPTVDLVINYDLPSLAADYVHRVGRTGRAGRPGWALSLVTQYDTQLVAAIEGHVGHKLASYDVDEAEVLRGLGRVYAAKKAAAIAALNERDMQAAGVAKGRAPSGGSKTKQRAERGGDA